ncbi:MAG: YifB family Mg chelatase-like AAA ATPase [bacterium]|nr:YifB family Mg chelatase-like AAA ATPase [bacterium]
MISKITSVAIVGLEAIPITVEIDIASQGLPQFVIVGLPNKSVDEARERVKSAIRNSGFDFPNKKITVNLAPADVPKFGSGYDLPIALGLLGASGQIGVSFENILVYGELSLDGLVRPCNGTVLFSILAREQKYEALFVPNANSSEAALIEGVNVYPCISLRNVVEHLNQTKFIPKKEFSVNVLNVGKQLITSDMSDVRGQYQVKRAMEIAASGSHNLIMIGSPGSGKTMLARTFSSILPDVTIDEAIELTKLYSIAGLLDERNPVINTRPFRAPHHTSSQPSIVGGGTNPRPGEISLAHRGALFMDELLEFPKSVLEALRQPLEDGTICVSRSVSSVVYPAKFILLAACNPCPCGYADSGEGQKECICSSAIIQKYKKRLSGPILDRIDLQIKVRPVPIDDLSNESVCETSTTIGARVQIARNIQTARFKGLPIKSNCEMTQKNINEFCKLNDISKELLRGAVTKMHLSARGYTRIIKVSRTIADIAQEAEILPKHIAEALHYRFVEN